METICGGYRWCTSIDCRQVIQRIKAFFRLFGILISILIKLISFFVCHSKLRLAHQHVEQRKKNGQSYENAANATAIELVQCAESHCRAFLVSSAYEMTKDIDSKLSPELAAVIHQLVELYAIDTCIKSTGDLLRVCVFHYINDPR